jgi:hypothetical protein
MKTLRVTDTEGTERLIPVDRISEIRTAEVTDAQGNDVPGSVIELDNGSEVQVTLPIGVLDTMLQ